MRITTELGDVPAAAWDALDHGPSPFLRHGFLHALHASGSVGPGSGWHPFYLVAHAGDAVVGGVAAYAKSHSYGEYIFDFAWANAAHDAGIRYYPKLVIAAPMTPATGRRILLGTNLEDAMRAATQGALVGAVQTLARELGVSSTHWLFCTADEQAMLQAHGFAARRSFQFHWHNRGYGAFVDFLAALQSRKRKNLQKERARAAEAFDELVWRRGDELTPGELAAMDRFYRRTTDEHGGRDYLRPGFFEQLARHLPQEMWMLQARKHGAPIAGALFLQGPGGLYGRYWGTDVASPFLHFEVAYYAGIERAIALGLPLFEAGAQGEHKLLRGFDPSPTYSSHWLAHPGLARAVADALPREAQAVAETMAELALALPYRREDDA